MPYGDKWAVKEGGSERPLEIFDTKEQAVKYGRDVAKRKGTEHFIHGRDGRIQDRDSYGNDPHPPKDKKQ